MPPAYDEQMTPAPAAPRVAGLVLAAGAGTRMGMPKALVTDLTTGEPWLSRAVRLLHATGCSPVVVVLGAEQERARALLPPEVPVQVVVAEHWADGLGASLRAGLTALAEGRSAGAATDAVLVTLVDLPHLHPGSLTRLIADAPAPSEATGPHPAGAAITPAEPAALAPDTLRQAVYDGRPGHPVLIGADHILPLIATLGGDTGARPYLRAHHATLIDCSDLGGGDDVDALPRMS